MRYENNMRIKLYPQSLRYKLLISFLLIGMVPYAIYLIYTMYVSQEKILNKLIKEQIGQVHLIKSNIQHQLLTIEKEVMFLATLDVMDDIAIEDIDKRVSRLLIQKEADIGEPLIFYGLNKDKKIVASSQKNSLGDPFSKLEIFEQYNEINHHFVHEKNLYFISKIMASFDEKKIIGYLILEYPLSNLNQFNKNENGVTSSIEKVTPLATFQERDTELIISERFELILNEYAIIYHIDKAIALHFLYDFISFTLFLLPIALTIILLTALIFARNIVKPIERLTTLSEEITKTKNYTAQVEVSSNDEIARLSNSFNHMIQATHNALGQLEVENKLRLKRFIQLIEIFNQIIDSKSEKECVDIALQNISKIVGKDKLYFYPSNLSGQNHIPIYTTNYETNSVELFGSIGIDVETIVDENERKFYLSISKMIALQIDKIHLIDKTQSASNAKSAFISNMSHELRTPLNAIIGFTQYIIAYEDVEDEMLDMIGNIESSAKYLLGMINEILDIAKIEAGKMERHIEAITLKSLIQDSLNMVGVLAEDKGLTLSYTYDDTIPTTIYSDPNIIRQIVLNLVSNSIKFTQTGRIDVTITLHENAIKIVVQDTGIGLSQESISMLFNDFTQVENVMQKQHKGTGLGLSLSKKLANILEGDLILESEGEHKGVRSIFTFKLLEHPNA